MDTGKPLVFRTTVEDAYNTCLSYWQAPDIIAISQRCNKKGIVFKGCMVQQEMGVEVTYLIYCCVWSGC